MKVTNPAKIQTQSAQKISQKRAKNEPNPAKVYLVTHGDYSSYAVHGVFDSRKDAVAFQRHFAYDNIEVRDLNPEFPRIDRYWYQVFAELDGSDLSVSRVNLIDIEECTELIFGGLFFDRVYQLNPPETAITSEAIQGKKVRFHFDFQAKDEKHAAKIANEKISAFRAGATTIRYEYRVTYDSWSGDYHDWLSLPVRVAELMMVDGQLTIVSTKAVAND